MNFSYFFNHISKKQINQFNQLMPLYLEWNSQINVISRKDIDQLYTRHVLHSLAIAKVVEFKDGSSILDVGTGGGFPGVPLAILFPNVEFVLIDSIAKKIKVVNEIVKALGLTNVKAIHGRAEKVNQKFDFIVSRAVTKMPNFIKWIEEKVHTSNNHSFSNGILYLKGGDLSHELSTINCKEFLISDFFDDPFFETKKVVYVPLV